MKTQSSARMGRPRLPTKEARSERVVTFLTPLEHSMLAELARSTDQSVSAMCHELLVQAMKNTEMQGRLEDDR